MKFIFAGFLIFITVRSFCCDCAQISVQDNFTHSDFVIVASVIQLDTAHHYIHQSDNSTGRGFKGTFKIIKKYKGEFVTDTITVESIASSCSYEFHENETYLIYGKNGNYSYETNMCTRTATALNNKDIEILDMLNH